MKTLVKMVHGSHLYGLNTENSDKDYKGVFMPDIDDLLLCDVVHEIRESTGDSESKNGAEDIDSDMYSIHKFFQMACAGETIAIDMLHAPENMIIETSPEWNYIQENRHLFYTKNMKAFLGYCKKQAAKYGVRGSRLAAIEKVINKIRELHTDELHLNDIPGIWPEMKKLATETPHFEALDYFMKGDKRIDKPVLNVCEAKYDITCKVDYVLDGLQKKYDAYGHRAQQAKDNQGIDWKAMSHALRAGYQLRSIYKTGDLHFPLAETTYILDVKQGERDFLTDVMPTLEALIEEVELLAENSSFSQKVNKKVWNEFILSLYKKH